jgi:hypothetical protein
MERNTRTIDQWIEDIENAYPSSPMRMPKNKLNPYANGGPQYIPVTDLQTGMTVWELTGNGWKQGPTLGKYFLTSLRFPTITFERKNGGGILEWHPCGSVYVTK